MHLRSIVVTYTSDFGSVLTYVTKILYIILPFFATAVAVLIAVLAVLGKW